MEVTELIAVNCSYRNLRIVENLFQASKGSKLNTNRQWDLIWCRCHKANLGQRIFYFFVLQQKVAELSWCSSAAAFWGYTVNILQVEAAHVKCYSITLAPHNTDQLFKQERSPWTPFHNTGHSKTVRKSKPLCNAPHSITVLQEFVDVLIPFWHRMSASHLHIYKMHIPARSWPFLQNTGPVFSDLEGSTCTVQ